MLSIVIEVFFIFRLFLHLRELRLDRFDILIEKLQFAKNLVVRLISSCLEVFAERTDLPFGSTSRLGGSVRSEPEVVARMLENLANIKHPDVILHHGTQFFQN